MCLFFVFIIIIIIIIIITVSFVVKIHIFVKYAMRAELFWLVGIHQKLSNMK